MKSKEQKPTQRQKHRPIKCEGDRCNTTIDINLALEVKDYDFVDSDKTKIYVYCPKCGLQHTYKL